MRSLFFYGLSSIALFLGGWSLKPRRETAEAAASQSSGDYDPMRTRPNEEGDTGERVYRRYCSGCHGVNGNGKGVAAGLLTPRPRDFTTGLYKFTSTPAGSPPLEEDLVRTITEGLRGTSMPSWRLLPERDRRSVASYVKAFFKEWQFRTQSPPVPFHENPTPMDDADAIAKAVAKGREVYHKKTGCWACHPAYMPKGELEALIQGPAREDLATALSKPDAWNETIQPPDFQQSRLKSVRSLKDLYQVIEAGVGGTAMPTWKDALTGPEAWALTLYVDSLRPDPFSVTKETLKKLKEAESK